MTEALAAYRKIADRIWERAEGFLSEAIDDSLRHRMQAAITDVYDAGVAKVDHSLRAMFTEPVVRIEHGEGSRLPPTNVEIDFAEPVIARTQLQRI